MSILTKIVVEVLRTVDLLLRLINTSLTVALVIVLALLVIIAILYAPHIGFAFLVIAVGRLLVMAAQKGRARK